MNKKGQETILDFTKLILNFGIVVVVAIFIVVVTISFLNTKYDLHDFQANLLLKTLISSENCLAYNDGLNTKSGIIDTSKFSNELLTQCYSNPNIGYKINLYNAENKPVYSSSSNSKLNDYIPICKSLPEYKCSIKNKYILYYENKELKKGILKAEVITVA